MTAFEEIFREAMSLAPDVRAELAERLIDSLAKDVSPEITSAHLAEVRRRIAEVESGKAELIPGDEVLVRARTLLARFTPSAEGVSCKSLGQRPREQIANTIRALKERYRLRQ